MSRSAMVRLVAGREIRDRLRGRALKISTVVSSLTIVAIIVIPSVSDSGGTPLYDVVVAGPADSELAESLRAAGDSSGVVLRVRPAVDPERVDAAVQAGRADIGLVNGEIVVDDALDPRGGGGRERAVAAIAEVVRVRSVLEEKGVDLEVVQEVLGRPAPAVRSLGRAESDTASQAVGFFGVVALFAFLQQYGSWVAYGVAEEKSTRVVEVLLSTVRPRELLTGKVLGIGAVAVAQGLIVAATALIAMEAVGDGLPESVTVARVLAPLGWFLLGYAFYCWAYASAGALAARTADLQSTIFPVTLPILIGYFVSVSASFGGEPSMFAKMLAYFPPTAPMLMLTLSAGGYVETWQVALSAGITIAATFLLARLAASIYSRSILRTGKRVKWIEALRMRAV